MVKSGTHLLGGPFRPQKTNKGAVYPLQRFFGGFWVLKGPPNRCVPLLTNFFQSGGLLGPPAKVWSKCDHAYFFNEFLPLISPYFGNDLKIHQ